MSSAVVTSPCIGIKDTACSKVCPVSCFFDAGEMLVINPDECTACGLCIPECPVQAIYFEEDVPETEKDLVQRAQNFFRAQTAEELEKKRIS